MERRGIPIIPFVVVAIAFCFFDSSLSASSEVSNFEPGPVSGTNNLVACGTNDPVFFCGNAVENPPVAQKNCSSCHFYHRDMVGPRLGGRLQEEPYFGWFEDFITNEDSLEKAGDERTLTLIEEWKPNGYRHNFDFLTREELSELRTSMGGW